MEDMLKAVIYSKGALVNTALGGDIQDKALKKHHVGKSLFRTRLGLL